MNLRGAFIYLIFATPILVRKSVLIELRWRYYQLKGRISSFFRSLVKISRSHSYFGIFIENKEEGVSQLFLRFRAFNYQYSIWIMSDLWPIWIMLLSVFCFNIMKVNHLRIASYYCYVGFLLFLCIITNASIESFDCILLSLLAFNAILLASSVNAICFSLLNLNWDFKSIYIKSKFFF